MTERVIHLHPLASPPRALPLNTAVPSSPLLYPLTDALGRRLHDLRISVTDRCNFRCVYCMPKEVFDQNHVYLPQAALLNFEEIERIARVFVGHGVEKLRLTGGEPLLRKHIERLVEKLASLRTPSGRAPEIAMTTNGTLLRKKARSLADAGLNRVTVSLDAMTNTTFKAMNDVDFEVEQVLDGIEAAAEAGLGPVKVNMVVKQSLNVDEIVPMARYFKGSPHILRFIEFMDVGASNGWKLDEVVPSARVINLINEQVGQLAPLDANYPGEVAKRWQYADGSGEIGVISSVTQAFCGDCSRIRLSTEGLLFTCLFASRGHDLRSLVRGDSANTDEQLGHAIANLWSLRSDRYSEIRTGNTPQPADRIEMSYIGG
ncbi:MAG: GTP 3',8-cyclase MoaA [Limnobacter sp.]|uniref:GTP 3',8-cyclase MoaA n=1 Tax=Limnobacter sp. TaxID=2003368 RepID=UPI003919D8C6